MVQVRDFRGATIDDLKHHLVPLLKKKAEHIILHIGTNDVVSKTSRQILDELLQLKQHIINTLPTCWVIVSRIMIETDNGKATLTLSNFNKTFAQLEVDFINHLNIKEVHLGRKGLHLNKKGKNRLEMNFLQNLRKLWWSTEGLNETYDKSCNLNRNFEGDLKDRDNLLNSISSSTYPDRQFDGISFSTLHELRKNNHFRVIIGDININSIINKFEPLKKWCKII